MKESERGTFGMLDPLKARNDESAPRKASRVKNTHNNKQKGNTNE